MAGRGTDILLGGNAEFMARQQCLAEQIAERLPKGEERFVEDERVRLLLSSRRVLPRAEGRLPADLRALQGAVRCRARRGHRARRPPHRRHRAARGAAHRQPAARPRRPSGRPRRVPLLPLARRRSDAHLRLGSDFRPDAEARHGRRRPDRARDGHARDRAGAEAGRGAELLRPQAPPRIRRRDEQAAREHLRAAPADSRRQDPVPGRGRPGDDGRHARLPDGSRRGDPRLAGRNLCGPPGRLRAVGPRRAQARSHPRLRDRHRRARLHRPDLRRNPRRAVGENPAVVRREGTAGRPRGAGTGRARHHAADRRQPVEGSPLQPRSPEGRHRPARLRPARSADRVQEGELRAVPGDEGSRGRGDRPLPVVAAAGDG